MTEPKTLRELMVEYLQTEWDGPAGPCRVYVTELWEGFIKEHGDMPILPLECLACKGEGEVVAEGSSDCHATSADETDYEGCKSCNGTGKQKVLCPVTEEQLINEIAIGSLNSADQTEATRIKAIAVRIIAKLAEAGIEVKED